MVLILDGGLGTELEKKGFVLNQDSLWSARLLVDAPDDLIDVHASFYRAGSDVVTTASYQFSFEGFKSRGIEREEAVRILQKSVVLADLARKRIQGETGRSNLKIAASLGSYGAIMSNGAEFTGIFDKNEEELVTFHLDRLTALLDDPLVLPDYIAFETLPSLSEVRAILKALRSFGKPILPKVWMSLSCRSGASLNAGDPIEEAAELIASSEEVDFLGFNCLHPNVVSELISRVKPLIRSKKFVIYPNRGEVFADREWKEGSGTHNDDLVSMAKLWLSQYPNIELIGGCCRVGTDGIAELSQGLAPWTLPHTTQPQQAEQAHAG